MKKSVFVLLAILAVLSAGCQQENRQKFLPTP